MKPPDTAMAGPAQKPIRHATTHHQYEKQSSHQHGKRALGKEVQSVAGDVFNHASHAFHVAEGVQDLRNEEIGVKSDKLANTYGLMSTQRQGAVAQLDREKQEAAAKVIQKYTRKYLRISLQRRLQETEDNDHQTHESDAQQQSQESQLEQEPMTSTDVVAAAVQYAQPPARKQRAVERLCQFPVGDLEGEMSGIDEEMSQLLQQEMSSPYGSHRCSDACGDTLTIAASTSVQQLHQDRRHSNPNFSKTATHQSIISHATGTWQGEVIARAATATDTDINTAASRSTAMHNSHCRDRDEALGGVTTADNLNLTNTEGRAQARQRMHASSSPEVANVTSRYLQIPQHHQPWRAQNDSNANLAGRAIHAPRYVLVQQPTTTPLEMQVTQLSRVQVANGVLSQTSAFQNSAGMRNDYPSSVTANAAVTSQFQQQLPSASHRHDQVASEQQMQVATGLLYPDQPRPTSQPHIFDRPSRRMQSPMTWQAQRRHNRPGSVGALSGLPLSSPGPFQDQQPRFISEHGIHDARKHLIGNAPRPVTSGGLGSSPLIVDRQNRRFGANIDEGDCRRSWEGPSPLHRQLLLSGDHQEAKSEPLTKLFHALAPAEDSRRGSLSIVEMVPYKHATESCVQAVRGWGGHVAQQPLPVRPASPLHSPVHRPVSSSNRPHNPAVLEVEARNQAQQTAKVDKSPPISPLLHQVTREAYSSRNGAKRGTATEPSKFLLDRRVPFLSKQPLSQLAQTAPSAASRNKITVSMPVAVNDSNDDEPQLLFQRVL